MTRTTQLRAKPRSLSPTTRNTINGILFALPWLVGLLMFWIYPIIASAYYSFTDFNGVQSAQWIGLNNYVQLFTVDTDFWHAIYNTLFFAGISIPLAIVTSFALAMLLNAKIKFQVVYRTIYFLPTLVPEVALALVWVYLFTPVTGLINLPFSWLGLRGPCWLACERWSRQTMILLALWIIGQQVVLYLAGLQDVPQDLYDAANVDGAGFWHKFRNVTLPMMTPVVFFHLVTSVIGALQFFTIPYIMVGGTGGPGQSLLFYSIYLYKQAFQYFHMGYASALAWLLFMTALLITLLIFRSARLWVFYSGADFT